MAASVGLLDRAGGQLSDELARKYRCCPAGKEEDEDGEDA